MSCSPAEVQPGHEVLSQAERPAPSHLLLAVVIVLAAALILSIHIQSLLESPRAERAPGDVLISKELRRELAGRLPASSPLGYLLPRAAALALAAWLVGATVCSVASGVAWSTTLWQFGLRFLWLGSLALFELSRGIAGLLRPDTAAAWLGRLPALLPLVETVAWGGFVASCVVLFFSGRRPERLRGALAHPAAVWLAAGIYAVTFSALSIFQYRALMVPHGDTAMYEEHLWNLLHGKGFRSQLDSGRLFFGEHLEVIHLLLLPAYVLLPCLPTLNVLLSVGLASGAIAVRGITQRITGCAGAANWLAVAYLLYFPLQYLNLEASLKTFRPENLGVPLLLFAIWCLESDRVRAMLGLLGLTLLAKEDYAVPVGMLGLYLAVRPAGGPSSRRLLGLGLFVVAVAYLWFVLEVFIPYFRQGPPHYAGYFKELGATPGEIVTNLIKQPHVAVARLFAGDAGYGNLLFLLMLVVPLGGSPIAGFSRLWVLAPSLLSILLIELDHARSPFFHFHAPLVPVLFWAAAQGVRRLPKLRIANRELLIEEVPLAVSNQQSAISNQQFPSTRLACFAAACALASGVWLGKSPLSAAFYDPYAGTRGFGLALYARGPRVEAFERMMLQTGLAQRLDASVAATDFVRPRFTHHRACHEYGRNGLKPHVPASSIDYIVMDLQGPYSNWLEGRQPLELTASPDRWEVVYDDLFYFLVVRARCDTAQTAAEFTMEADSSVEGREKSR